MHAEPGPARPCRRDAAGRGKLELRGLNRHLGGTILLKLLFSAAAAQGASAAIVVLCSVIIGRQAAIGMGAAQWGWAALILGASISLAVLVWAPVSAAGQAKVRSKAKDDDVYY
jgi:hypothetical protein